MRFEVGENAVQIDGDNVILRLLLSISSSAPGNGGLQLQWPKGSALAAGG